MAVHGDLGGTDNSSRSGQQLREEPIKLALFDALTFYSSDKIHLRELRALFADHRTDPASDLVEFWNTPTSRTRATSILIYRSFSAVCVCTAMTEWMRKEHENPEFKVVSAGLSETCRCFAQTLILRSRKCW